MPKMPLIVQLITLLCMGNKKKRPHSCNEDHVEQKLANFKFQYAVVTPQEIMVDITD